jgi:hypothetical protein
VLQDHERRTEARGIERLLAGRGDPDVGVVGVADTLAAINRGRIGVLYVLQRFSCAGWLCDACDYLGVSPAPPACLACGATVSAFLH